MAALWFLASGSQTPATDEFPALGLGGSWLLDTGTPEVVIEMINIHDDHMARQSGAMRISQLAARIPSGQAWLVDVRVKTFAQEAADRLGFLRTEFGFNGPETVPNKTGVYPLLHRVRFRRADLAVEISLVLSYMGEEYVAADLVSEDESGSVCRAELGRGTAHTGYQMRHALDLQARAVRRALSECTPHQPGLNPGSGF